MKVLGTFAKPSLKQQFLILDPKNPVNLLQIVDKPNIFPDSMTVEWNSTLLALHTKDIIESYISPENKDSINILTFDYFGVSGHANHRALFMQQNYCLMNHELLLTLLNQKMVVLLQNARRKVFYPKMLLVQNTMYGH